MSDQGNRARADALVTEWWRGGLHHDARADLARRIAALMAETRCEALEEAEGVVQHHAMLCQEKAREADEGGYRLGAEHWHNRQWLAETVAAAIRALAAGEAELEGREP